MHLRSSQSESMLEIFELLNGTIVRQPRGLYSCVVGFFERLSWSGAHPLQCTNSCMDYIHIRQSGSNLLGSG